MQSAGAVVQQMCQQCNLRRECTSATSSRTLNGFAMTGTPTGACAASACPDTTMTAICGRSPVEPVCKLDAVDRAGHAHIGNHRVRLEFAQAGQRLVGIACLGYIETMIAQVVGQIEAYQHLVFNYEHRRPSAAGLK